MSEVAFEWDFSSPEQEVLAEVPRRLAALHPRKIVLFGSRAEGTARKDSDYDLLVVMELDDPAGPRSVPVQRLLQGLPVPFDVIVYTPEEWEAFRTHPLAMAHRIAETGRVLYDAP